MDLNQIVTLLNQVMDAIQTLEKDSTQADMDNAGAKSILLAKQYPIRGHCLVDKSDFEKKLYIGCLLAFCNSGLNKSMEEFRQQTGIVYNGPKLTPFTRYLATLEITDNYGETASTSLEFETGFVGKEWNASWITDGAYQFKERKKSPRPMTFKKDFFIKGEIRQDNEYV